MRKHLGEYCRYAPKKCAISDIHRYSDLYAYTADGHMLAYRPRTSLIADWLQH